MRRRPMEKHTLVVSGWAVEWFLAYCEAHRHTHSQGLAIIAEMAIEHYIDPVPNRTWEESNARQAKLATAFTPEAIRALRESKFDPTGRVQMQVIVGNYLINQRRFE
jgi:hypothetical protein